MPVEVIMPKVDMDMTTGTFAVWHVEEGAAVAKGEPLFDIETDKSAMEVEAPASGRLHHRIAQPGEIIAVGAPVAWIYAEGEAVGEPPTGRPVPLPAARPVDAGTSQVSPTRAAPPLAAIDRNQQAQASMQPAYGSSAAAATPPTVAAAMPPSGEPAAPATSGAAEATRATPAARRLARDGQIEIAGLTGSGPQGRVQRGDVEEAISAQAQKSPPADLGPPPSALAETRGTPVARLAEAAPPVAWTAQSGALHVSRRKGTGVPLVLIHGFTADSMGWAPFERELPRDMPLIRIDLPAHGRSPRSRVGSFQDLLRALTRAFDEACDGPVHLLGHSLGGALALGLADIRPRQVATLTLLAPAGLGPEIDAAALTGIARASRTESLAPWLQRLTARPDGLSWDFARAAMLSRTDPELRAAQLDLADALFPDDVQAFDLTAALERVTAPAAVIWGRQDRILPWRHALAAPGEMALHLMPGVGHIPHIERPAELARIVARHLGTGAPS